MNTTEGAEFTSVREKEYHHLGVVFHGEENDTNTSDVSAVHSPLWTIAKVLIVIWWTGSACVLGAYVYQSVRSAEAVAPDIYIEGISGVTSALSYGEQPLLSEPNFFQTVHDTFIAGKTSFIEADLATMRLSVYEKGVLVEDVPILTKGKEGSWWETPAGIYKIASKETEHFSTFGSVYQPWSMAFQGNFFIHGWPHYADGTPVSSKYSGGCIRLSDEDAKKIYDRVAVGTPVLVHEKDFETDGFSYARVQPDVTADEYLVADIESNTVLVSQKRDIVHPIASVTKLFTALVAAEYINLDKDILIPAGLGSTSIPRLVSGTQTSAYGLLFPLLLESSNEAADTFASALGKDRFVTLMNRKAESLGMHNTSLSDPAGRNADNVSTPGDLYQLLRYLYNNRSFILKITTGEPVPTLYRDPAFENIQNFNPAPGFGGFRGGKVGLTTAAQETAVALYSGDAGNAKRTYAFIVLGSKDRNADIVSLIRYLQVNYGVTFIETKSAVSPVASTTNNGG